MSILAAATTLPATQPAEAGPEESWIFLAAIALISLIGFVYAALRLGLLRPSKVAGPPRVAPTQGVWPLWVGVGLAIVSLIMLTVVVAMALNFRLPEEGPAPKGDADLNLTVLSAVPPVIAFFVVTLLVSLIQPGTLRGIGFSSRTLASGIRTGLLAALIVIPWTWLSGYATEYIYQLVDYKHPTEHDLLRVMTTPNQLFKWLAIIGAVLVAPVWEELVFRGLFQTALTEGLLRLFYPVPREGGGFPVIPMAGDPHAIVLTPPPAPPDMAAQANGPSAAPLLPPVPPDAAVVMPYAPVPVLPLAAPPRAVFAWISILVTSALFALVHPLWSAPEIFCLAVALGYLYERTGKLWVSMTVHAAFNIISVVFYLTLR